MRRSALVRQAEAVCVLGRVFCLLRVYRRTKRSVLGFVGRLSSVRRDLSGRAVYDSAGWIPGMRVEVHAIPGMDPIVDTIDAAARRRVADRR